MYLSLVVSWWLAVPLAILAGAFLVRVFINSPRLWAWVILQITEGQ